MTPTRPALTPLVILSALSVSLALSSPSPAQTVSGRAPASPTSPGSPSAPPSNPDTPADRNAKATNPANTGTTAGSGTTQSLMQRMRRECGSKTDAAARTACEDGYRRQMEQAAGTGNQPGQFEHNREQPGKPQ